MLVHCDEKSEDKTALKWCFKRSCRSVCQAMSITDYATGGEFDSTAAEVTEWYARTDEEGHAIGYDYESGRFVDDDPSVADGEFVSGTAEDDAQTPPAP